MSVDTSAILSSLSAAIPAAGLKLLKNPGPSGQDAILVAAADLPCVCKHLKEKEGFDFLSNVTGVDWPDPAVAVKVAVDEAEGAVAPGQGFLEVVYHLFSTTRRLGPLVLKCRTQDRDRQVSVPSVVGIYRSAEFQEREAYDLFGIRFDGHPDLRRILMWDEFVDHPMRKDYVAPDDYEYEPTPHDEVLEKARRHYPSSQS